MPQTAHRTLAMLTLSIAIGLAVLDSVIANIALPSIATALAISPAASVWVVNAYQIAMTVALLPLASLGDISGHRRVYIVGLVLFTLASLACGMAQSLPALVLARLLQGVGAACITAVNMALVRYIYPPDRLGQGMGIIGLVVAAAATAGPSIASAILAVAPWPFLFLLNVPLGVLALALAWQSLPVTPRSGHRFDYASALLNAVGVGLIFLGASGFGEGSQPARSGLELGLGLAVFTFFIRLQTRLAAPMLPIDLLRLPVFAVSAATSVCAYICQTLVFVALPFAVLVAGGRSQVETGVLMTPWPAALVVVAPLAGRLADRYAAGPLCGAGLAIMTLGTLLLARLPADAPMLAIMAPMLLCGAGFGLFQSPNNRAFMASAPLARSGACAGMMTTARLTGQTIGGLIVASTFALTGIGPAAVAQGVSIAMVAATLCAAAATTISLLRLRQPT